MIEVKKFYGTWCGPCRIVEREFVEIRNEVSGVKFTDIDVDENREMAHQYGVRSIPLVVIEKDGQIIQRIQGSQPKSAYVNAINGCR